MLRCAITDGTASGFVNATQIERIENQVRRWATDGIDFIQLREKNLDAGALHALAETAVRVLREMQSAAKLLINARADVAIAAGADGVHLTTHLDELTPQQVRALFAHPHLANPIVSVACHTPEEIARARDNGADFILFGPIFEKTFGAKLVTAGVGLEALQRGCELAAPVPVLALGGVTATNATDCLSAGTAGIAGIRTFL